MTVLAQLRKVPESRRQAYEAMLTKGQVDQPIRQLSDPQLKAVLHLGKDPDVGEVVLPVTHKTMRLMLSPRNS